MGRYGIHHHDAVQFHYPNQFFYDIPKISLPEDISSNHLKSIYSSLLKLKDNFYTNLLEEARIPIILVGNSPWVKYEKESGKLRLNGGAWTINVDEANLIDVNKIVYITEGFIYDIEKNDAIEHGYFRNFRGENKLVVPLTKWRKRRK